MKTICKQGFSLLEMLVVVLVVGILVTIAVPQYQKAVEEARSAQAITALKSLTSAQKVYHLSNGTYATKFNQLDVDMSGWTGTTKLLNWSGIIDTCSNNEWSLQMFKTNDQQTMFIGHLTGPYKGTGFLQNIWQKNRVSISDPIFCIEWNVFKKTPGDYCIKIMGYSFASGDPYTRVYVKNR